WGSIAGVSRPNSEACHESSPTNIRSHLAGRDRCRQVSCQTSKVVQVVPIASADDARLAAYQLLTDAEHRRRLEGAEGTFVVEGVTAIRRALTSPYSVRSLLLTPAKAAVLAPDLTTCEAEVYVVQPDVMTAVAGF